MRQDVTKTKISEESIKKIVSEQFFQTINEAIDKGLVKHERDFADVIDEAQTQFSKIKNPKYKRSVTVDMLYKAVNNLGLNANHILVEGGNKTEKLERDNVNIKGGNVSGNNNVVLTGQAVSNGGDVYFQVSKLIQKLPAKYKKAILDEISGLKVQNTSLHSEIEDLKKTIARYEREIEKDKKLIEAQEKLIKVMEGTPSKK